MEKQKQEDPKATVPKEKQKKQEKSKYESDQKLNGRPVFKL